MEIPDNAGISDNTVIDAVDDRIPDNAVEEIWLDDIWSFNEEKPAPTTPIDSSDDSWPHGGTKER